MSRSLAKTILGIIVFLSTLSLFYGCASKNEPPAAPLITPAASTSATVPAASTTPGMETSPAPSPTASTGDAGSGVLIRKAKPEEIGKKATCPVRGEEFTVSDITSAAEYKGKVYFFCCDDCPPKFKEDPEKYIKK